LKVTPDFSRGEEPIVAPRVHDQLEGRVLDFWSNITDAAGEACDFTDKMSNFTTKQIKGFMTDKRCLKMF